MWAQIAMAVVQMAMSMKQAADQKKAASKQAQQQLDAQAKEKWAEYEQNEKQRKDQLKKALAKRRARMGASGFSAADGSAGAVIQGLRTDAAEGSHKDFTERKESLDNSVSSIHANLLEQSDKHKRGLYKQAGSSIGSIAGGMIGGDAESAQMGGRIGGMFGGVAAGS